MSDRDHRRALAAALLTATLVLTGCGASGTPDVELDEAETIEPAAPAEEAPEDTGPPPGTEGLSQEAIDQGHTVTELPGGWPEDLPLPEGIPVIAFRDGQNFSLVYDLVSVEAGQDVMTWYQDAGWSVEGDFEGEGVHLMEFGSPETNDYGPLRRVSTGLGMSDWPTGFQYSLQVQE